MPCRPLVPPPPPAAADPRQAERGDLLQILYHLPKVSLRGLKPKLEHLQKLFSKVDCRGRGSLTPAETQTLVGTLMGQQRKARLPTLLPSLPSPPLPCNP